MTGTPRGGELRTVVVDPADRDALRRWYEAVGRGFHAPAAEDAAFDEIAPDLAGRRVVAVLDDTAADPADPVATIDSWTMPLTVPGGARLPVHAVTHVSVSATHRRRGIARGLLEEELREAVRRGSPLAALTATEAVLYGRYGFGPATWTAELAVDPRRAGWRGSVPPGRVHYVGRDRVLADAPGIGARAGAVHAGSMGLPGLLATRVFGRPSDRADLRGRRFLRYDDEAGEPQGYAVYSTREERHFEDVLQLHALVGATDAAVAALWRTVLSLDLVVRVEARDRPVDDVVRWLVADPRAVTTRAVADHLWLRVLDVPAVLEARTWAGAGAVDFEVADPLGHAAGRFRLEVDAGGAAAVRRGGDGRVRLPVESLASLLLGGQSVRGLAAAGLVDGDEDGIARLDGFARTPRAPWLGFWF